MDIIYLSLMTKDKKIKGYLVVQDEAEAAKCLANGQAVSRFEYGDSMQPILRNGEYAILHPITDINAVKRGDAVFCRFGDGDNSYYMTHMVADILESPKTHEKFFAIESTDGYRFGWTPYILAIAESTGIIEPPLSM